MTINEPKDAFLAVREIIKNEEREEVYIILLNALNKVIDIKFEALGDEARVIIPKKFICRDAILAIASGVILVHTHPSGNPIPSKSDIDETGHLREMLNTLDVQLVDHIIVAGDKRSYYSFCDGVVSSAE